LSARTLSFALAAAATALNLVLQHLLMAMGARTLIPGLADFEPAWNRGVSFSLLVQTGDTGRYLLIAVLAIVTVFVAVLAWRAAGILAGAGFGLILGGAIGNLLDRLQYGAVFDFLALHLGSTPLFVCNLPDIFISAGVVLLAADSLWGPAAKASVS
jgi:signal peptidase II